MQVKNILINHMTEPLGFNLSNLRVEFALEDVEEKYVEKQLVIWTTERKNPVYQTNFEKFDNNYFEVPMKLSPRTKYNVQVNIKVADDVISGKTFFETGKMQESFTAKWIINQDKNIQNTLFKKEFLTTKKVQKARLYIAGLGLYEAYLNNQKIGDEFLAPGATDYNSWVQVQTYDVTKMLSRENTILISNGDGWYKGRYGFDGGRDKIYGDQQMVIAELHVLYEDGNEEVINTDSSWLTTSGKITKSSIYYGEDIDDTIEPSNWQKVQISSKTTSILKDRLSLPITIHENLKPIKLITSPKGEKILDFGQNHAGLIEFYNREPKGTKITIEMGEILQDGNFYRDNLRDARAAFTYISDGNEKWVRPHFTYYGFRYAKISGNTKSIDINDYKAPVLYSDIEETGSIKTDSSLVNRLFENIKWGQKSNFMDVPTDCPQRDERLGWTGDANIFSNTAAINMNVFEFYKKYAQDIKIEQAHHDGRTPMYAPAMGDTNGGPAVWGDAATFIPWNMYLDYGDTSILKQNYSSMKDWVDWITQHTEVSNLWVGTFQFGDWLALDAENPGLPIGKTDVTYIASIYYYASSNIVSKTAELLGYQEDAKRYHDLASQIYQKICDEYITKDGKIAIDTQTAYTLALHFNLVNGQKKERVAHDLVQRLYKDNDHLMTGFIGTPFINQVLSQNGYHKLAVKIFLQEDFPSWLYAVKMGATTVWERWNSVLEDGSMNPQGMNSLNHYSIGAIEEWAFRYVLGIRNQRNGYQEIDYEPIFDYRLKHVKGHYESSYGDFKAEYQIETNKNHEIKVNLTVPYGVRVNVKLPRANTVTVNGKSLSGKFMLDQEGHYQINYCPTKPYIEYYSLDTRLKDIFADKGLMSKLNQATPIIAAIQATINDSIKFVENMNLKELMYLPSVVIPQSELDKIEQILTTTPLESERD